MKTLSIPVLCTVCTKHSSFFCLLKRCVNYLTLPIFFHLLPDLTFTNFILLKQLKGKPDIDFLYLKFKRLNVNVCIGYFFLRLVLKLRCLIPPLCYCDIVTTELALVLCCNHHNNVILLLRSATRRLDQAHECHHSHFNVSLSYLFLKFFTQSYSSLAKFL